MAGNVWEWCHAPYKPAEPNGPRVLRGGSWLEFTHLARCAFRGHDYPRARDSLIGFRVCVSPFSSTGH